MIHFTRYTIGYFILSLVVITIGLFSLFTGGMKLGIDFTGGSTIVYSFDKDVTGQDIEAELKKQKIDFISVQEGSEGTYVLRTESITEQEELSLRNALEAGQERFDSVGPALGKETLQKTGIASLVAVIGILLYISFTFKKLTYGIAAVAALLHDVVILAGMYSLLSRFGAEIDALFVTALLTTMSFSVHDTIVVFDKIREYTRTSGLPIEDLANKALTETMVRSLNNSLTIVLMLVPLTLIGGETVRYFAAALLIGTIAGTYSSPFVATPLLVLLENWRMKR